MWILNDVKGIWVLAFANVRTCFVSVVLLGPTTPNALFSYCFVVGVDVLSNMLYLFGFVRTCVAEHTQIRIARLVEYARLKREGSSISL